MSTERQAAPYTPGPWEVEYDGEAHIIRMGSALPRSSSHAVQHVIVYDHGLAPLEHEDDPETLQFREAEANARLMASAPDLLAALRGLMASEWPPVTSALQYDGVREDAWAAARAARDKAEGRQP